MLRRFFCFTAIERPDLKSFRNFKLVSHVLKNRPAGGGMVLLHFISEDKYEIGTMLTGASAGAPRSLGPGPSTRLASVIFF